MSYDFLMFKLKKPIQSHMDLSEDTTTVIGSGEEIKEKISALLPSTKWRLSDDNWWGTYQGDDTWYEFSVENKETNCFSIHTSFRTDTRNAVKEICDALGVVAFDGQAGKLIGSLSPNKS